MFLVAVLPSYDYRFEAEFCGDSRRHSGLIRLRTGRVYQHIASALYGLGNLEFKLSNLITTQRHTRQVFPLNIHVGAVYMPA